MNAQPVWVWVVIVIAALVGAWAIPASGQPGVVIGLLLVFAVCVIAITRIRQRR